MGFNSTRSFYINNSFQIPAKECTHLSTFIFIQTVEIQVHKNYAL